MTTSELCEKCSRKRTCKYYTGGIYIGKCDEYKGDLKEVKNEFSRNS